MKIKMKKSIFVILLLLVIGYISWQMSAVIYSGLRHGLSDSKADHVANMSKKTKLRRISKLKHGDTICSGDACHTRHKHSAGLTEVGSQFHLDGKPFRILGGSFHYFRSQPHQWIDRLERLKAAGLNTVTTYIPWNLHEKIRGKYNFSGRWKLFSFINLVWKMGLNMIVRPGPFICAEWDLGGLPAWLLHDPNMTVRTSKYYPYLERVELYFNQLLPLLAKHTYKNGGPIIAFQIENEFGNYGPDENYLRFLSGLYQKHGLRELYFTSDNALSPERLERGSLPGVLATVNFNEYPIQALQRLQKFQPNRPLMVTEFWPGWFDSWGQSHHTMSAVTFHRTVDVILSMNASINFYMFAGGTNFGFWNGASFDGNLVHRYMPTTTSYDYDALVSESGDCHPTKYKALRLLLLKHKLVSHSLPPVPTKPSRGAYGSVAVTDTLKMDGFAPLLRHKPVTLKHPVYMEFLNLSNHGGQAFGWILYRTPFDFGSTLTIQGRIHNRAHVFVNGELVKIVYNTLMTNLTENVLVEMKHLRNKDNILEILVENMGRVSGWKLDEQRHGFQGTVTVSGRTLSHWEHVSLDFSDEFTASVGKSTHWKPFIVHRYPSLYRGFLDIQNLHDTFLYMERWTKGIVIVNGYNIGRYWNVGPQQTLYIPKQLLKKARNEIIVFELEKPADKLEFVAEAILDRVPTILG